MFIENVFQILVVSIKIRSVENRDHRPYTTKQQELCI